MRFTTGDLVWDASVYGTLVTLFSFVWTAATQGNVFFAVLSLAALVAELYVTWVFYVPLVRTAEMQDAWSKQQELESVRRSSPEYLAAKTVLEARERELMEAKRKERSAKSGQTEEWHELRGQ